MANPFLERGERTKNLTHSHKRAKKQEKEIAKKLGGRMVPGSGCGATKGDVRLKGIARIECKTTKNKSFSITMEMLEKIEAAGVSGTEAPVIVVEFNDGNGKALREVVVMPMYALQTLLDNQRE